MSANQNRLIITLIGLVFSSVVSAETHLYAVLMQSLSNPFWSAAEQGAKNTAESAEVDYYLRTVEGEQAAPQLEACNAMVERRPSVMLAAAINPTNLLPCLQRANDLKIPVVDLGGTLVQDDSDIEIAFSIQSDNQSAGAQAAEHIASHAPTESGHVLAIANSVGHINDKQRIEGFITHLAKVAPQLEVIQSTVDVQEATGISNVIDESIEDFPDLKAVFATTDDIAIEATESIHAAGVNDSVIVVGVDGSPGAIALIKAGRLNASVSSLPYLVGKQAIEHATEVLNGNTTEKVITVPTIVLTKELLDEGTEPMLEFVR